MATPEEYEQMRTAGFSDNEIAQLDMASGGFGSDAWWQKAQWLQQQRAINWQDVADKGYTLQQIQWMQNLPSVDAVWKQLESWQHTVPPGGPGGLPGIPPIPSGLAGNTSAKAAIEQTLGMFGLSSLADWAWNSYLNGAPIEQIMLDIRERPEYKSRFPAMAALAQKGRAITEAQYISYENNAIGMMRAAGIPAGFYDQPGDFTELIAGEVALPELQQRVQSYLSLALDTENTGEMERLYGVTPGHLAAYFMDAEKALPLLERRAQASLIGARSVGTGFGELAASEAERLASLGVNPEQAANTFGALAGMKELFNPLDQGEQAIGRATQLGAGFENNATAQQEIEQRRRRRSAAFQQSGEFASSQEGFGGVGEAR